MWRDTPGERKTRYEEILSRSPFFYEAAKKTENFREHIYTDAREAMKSAKGRKPADLMKSRAADGAAAVSKAIETTVTDYVIAPMLHAFVLWVLHSAMENGHKRLYFLARDGYLMYNTAVRMCRDIGIPVDCRYLYCSRYSIRVPMYHLDMDETLDYICRGGMDLTLKRILDRSGLTAEQISGFADKLTEQRAFWQLPGLTGAAGENQSPENIHISHAALAGLRQLLSELPGFTEAVAENSGSKMEAAAGYLTQEGLRDDIPYAIVDSGWVGSMQKVLGQLLQKDDMEGYYWGLYELPQDVDPDSYHCYYFTPGEGLKRKVDFANCLFEAIFSAPHGMTLSYEKKPDLESAPESGRGKTFSYEGSRTYIPVLAEIDNEYRLFIKREEMRLERYTRHVIDMVRRAYPPPEKDFRYTVRKLLRLFMSCPTEEEARIYGNFPFSDDVLEYSGRLAADLTQQELAANHLCRKSLAMMGIGRGVHRESGWYEASAVMAGTRINKHLRGYRRYKTLLYISTAYRKQRSTR